MSRLRSIATGVVVVSLAGAAHAASPAESLVAEARELIDTSYGRMGRLNAAGELLAKARERAPDDANVYVEAARFTIKRGYIGGGRYNAGATYEYGQLIDRALELDPKHPAAHLLKAGWHDLRGEYHEERAALDLAARLGAQKGWLWAGYARYYENSGDYRKARQYYVELIEMGPGDTHDTREPYLTGLLNLAQYRDIGAVPAKVRELADLARKARHPDDAWTLGNMAWVFGMHYIFDDTIQYARAALAEMDYGHARFMLAVGLYGKAAELINAGQGEAARPLIAEAATFGYSRETLLGSFRRQGIQNAPIAFTVDQILRGAVPR